MSALTAKEKGDLYEIFVRNTVFKTCEDAWIWAEIPEYELRLAGVLGNWNEWRLKRKRRRAEAMAAGINPLQDTGVDIVIRIADRKYELIQCKNYDESNPVTQDCLAGFFAHIIAYRLKGHVYYTSRLSANLSAYPFDSSVLSFVKLPMTQTDIDEIHEIQRKKIEDETRSVIGTPRDYQLDAYREIKKDFEGFNRATLHLPCGMGKTLVSILVAREYSRICILAPLKAHCQQNLMRFLTELTDYTGLIMDSDGTRDIEEVREFIMTNQRSIISATYKSVDILYSLKHLYETENGIIIID